MLGWVWLGNRDISFLMLRLFCVAFCLRVEEVCGIPSGREMGSKGENPLREEVGLTVNLYYEQLRHDRRLLCCFVLFSVRPSASLCSLCAVCKQTVACAVPCCGKQYTSTENVVRGIVLLLLLLLSSSSNKTRLLRIYLLIKLLKLSK